MSGSEVSGSAAIDAVWPLVGRDELLARVTPALRSPSTRMIVLTGEAGVGKTRVSTAAAEAAAAEGALVILVHGNPVLSAVPLGVAGPILPADAPAADPAALFEAVRAHLTARAEGRRIVLQAESAAILDPVTTALVGQLVGARVVTLIATIRTGDPLPDALSSSWSPDDCARFEVEPLTPAQAGDLLQIVLGGPVAWHVTDELHAASGGNPLYLRELVIGAVSVERLVLVAGAWQLTGDPVPTPALRELVLAHVRRLDEESRDIVERLAVCGVLPVGHLPGAGARATLAGLEQAGLVVIGAGQGALSVRLSQQQYGGVVKDGLSVLRTADIALEQADRLAADGGEDVLRIALWRLDAGAPVDDDTLLAAAELASLTHDHRTVERLTGAASESGSADARLLFLRGTALARLGRLTESLATLEAAGARAVGGDSALVLQIATARAFAHASLVDGTQSALAVLDALPSTLAESPGVTLMRATLARYEHRVAEARRLLDDVAPAFTGSAVEAAVFAHAIAPVLSAQGDDAGALDAALRGLEHARTADTSMTAPIPIASVECGYAEVLLQAGRLAEAFDAGIRALRLATAGDDQFVTRHIEFTLGRIELERGRLEAAARWFREVAGGGLARGPISLVAPAAGALATVRASQGDAVAAAEALALVPDGAPARNPTGIIAAGISAARSGDLGAAAGILLAAAREAEESGYPFLAGIHLFTLARWGDARAAADRLEDLVGAGAGEYTALQARHARAEADGDRAGLASVAAEWERRGAVLYAAEAFASAARLAHGAGESRAATGYQSRSDSLAALSQGAVTPLLRFTASLVPLTAREREIAALAAHGGSSKEIADRLFLSARTVDNHLQSIYGKLGIRGRRELADAIG